MQRLGAGMIPTRPRQHRRQPIQASSMAAPRNMAKALLLLPLPPRLCLPMAIMAHLLQTRGAGLLRPRSRGMVTGLAPAATLTSPGGAVSAVFCLFPARDRKVWLLRLCEQPCHSMSAPGAPSCLHLCEATRPSYHCAQCHMHNMQELMQPLQRI